MKNPTTRLWNRWIPIALLCAATPLRAQFGAPITAPAPVNSNASIEGAGDSLPKLATDGAGHWVCVWVTMLGAFGADEDILVARSSDNGQTWSTPAPLNTNAASDGASYDRFPDLATDGHGIWIAVWTSNNTLGGTIGTDSDILFAKSADNGLTWTAPAPLNSNAAVDSGADNAPAIAATSGGTWIVAWSGDNGFGFDKDIKFARSTNAGTSWSLAAPLNTNAGTDFGDDTQVHVATDDGANWIAVWTSTDDLGGTIGTDTDILCAHSVNGGVSWSAPQPVKTTASTDGTAVDSAPCIAADGLGNWVCVWQATDVAGGPLGTDYDILAARSENVGATWSAPQIVNTNAAVDAGTDWFPRIATDRDGNWVAVWQSTNLPGGGLSPDWDVFVARSSIAGYSWTAPALLNTNGASDSGADTDAQIATDRHGHWLAAWASPDTLGGTVGPDQEIFGARFVLPETTAEKFCFGDGSIAPCPCNNQSPIGAQEGCRHSSGTGGRLDAIGNPYALNPTLTLYASALPIPPASVLHIYMQGTSSAPAPIFFGDGLRCVSGILKRIGTLSGPGGSAYGYATGVNLAAAGMIPPSGGIYVYQVWYRDSHSTLCSPAHTFNISAALSVFWYP